MRIHSHSVRGLFAIGATALAGLAVVSPPRALDSRDDALDARDGRLLAPDQIPHSHGVSGRPSSAACPTNACSTNSSGYAATGRNGAYTSISTSWTRPQITGCTKSDPTG